MSNAWGFKVIKIYWLETSVYYNLVFTKQMQYKKLNQMRFVSTNTGNQTYEMATKQFRMARHQTHSFDFGQLSEIFSFSLFILILYPLIPFHFCEGNPTNRIVACTHVSVISCMFSWDDHVFHEISKIREFLFGIMRIMNIHWNKKSSMSWPKVTCNTHMQNGPWVIDDARKYDVHWPALCLFPSGIYYFKQGVYK